jgi:Skp family chaperone for outer membrane proteins
MNQPRLALIGLLAGLVAASGFASSAHAQAAGPKIAVINLRQVYTTIQETQDSQHQLRGMQDALDLKVKRDQDDLKDMQAQIEAKYKPGTDQHEQAMADFDAKSLQFQQDEQSQKVKMVRSQAKQMFQAYGEISKVVADMAKAKGIDVVLVTVGQDLPTNAMDIANPETLGNLIFGRNVVYVADKIDISADVIAKLDADYKAGGAKPAAAPTGK